MSEPTNPQYGWATLGVMSLVFVLAVLILGPDANGCQVRIGVDQDPTNTTAPETP